MSISYYAKKRFEDEDTIVYDVCTKLDENGELDTEKSMLGAYAIRKYDCKDANGDDIDCIRFLESHLEKNHSERLRKNKKYLPIFKDIISRL